MRPIAGATTQRASNIDSPMMTRTGKHAFSPFGHLSASAHGANNNPNGAGHSGERIYKYHNMDIVGGMGVQSAIPGPRGPGIGTRRLQ